MRDRLVLALVGITMAVIALYGLPRAYLLADLVQSQEERKIERSADLIADLVVERAAGSRPVGERFLDRLLNEAEYVEYVAPDGTRVTAGPEPVWDGTEITSEVDLPNGGEVRLSRSGDLVGDRVSDALLPLILIGLVLLLLAAVVAVFLARVLARPFTELAARARRLGEGRFDVEVPHYRVPEAEQIGAALRGAATQLDDLVRREREFALNASHQLRTPITALRLELEDLTLWPETAPEVADHLRGTLRELDRLSSAIDELLDLARGQRLEATEVDLAALVGRAVERWRDRFEETDRPIVQPDNGPVVARLPAGPVAQVLDVLLENAADHGVGKVEVEAYDRGTHVQVRVRDEGTPTFGPEVFRRGVTTTGTGIGLAVASELAEVMGGHLSLETGAPTCFVLRLPRPTEAT